MFMFMFIFLILYISIIFKYILGWSKENIKKKSNFYPTVSVVVAFRNEEENIPNLVSDLRNQKYSEDKLEFIFINDHSTDNTFDLLKKGKFKSMQVLNLTDTLQGKKHAISKGISIAKGEIILTTDADCRLQSGWIKSMVSYFSNKEIKLVSGPVNFIEKRSFFLNFQSLEFLSLIGSGAGAILNNNAIFCNAANLAYRRQTFMELNHHQMQSIASGDDVFLLHAIKRNYPNSIVFAKEKAAIVKTKLLNTFSAFINQRKRWTAKSIVYKDFFTIYTSYIVLLTNFLYLILLFSSVFDNNLFSYFIYFHLAKFIIDIIFFYPILCFFKRKDLLKWIFIFEFLYSIYIVLIVILSFTSKFNWKGRSYTK